VRSVVFFMVMCRFFVDKCVVCFYGDMIGDGMV